MSPRLRFAVFLVMVVLVAVMWGMAWISKRFEAVAAGVAALEPIELRPLTGVAVGTGGTFENHRRLGPGVVFGFGQDLILVDAGRGIAPALRAAGIPVSQPRHVVLTTLHPENGLGLDDLWLTGWLEGRSEPLRVIGPPGLRGLVKGLQQAWAAPAGAMGRRWELPPAGAEIEITEVEREQALDVGRLKLRLHRIAEGGAAMLALRVEAGGHSMALASAGLGADELEGFAQGVDWLWLGAIYGASLDQAEKAGALHMDMLRREAKGHFLLEKVGTVAAAAEARGLVLMRLRPPPVFASQYRSVVGRTYQGAVVIAEDGEHITP